MKVYLAGPMRGYPEHNFPAFMAYAAELRRRGHEVFNPAEKGIEAGLPHDPDAMEALQFRRDVFALDTAWICLHAEVVALMPGWEKSRGAVAEKALADAVGLRVVYLDQEDGWQCQSLTKRRSRSESDPAATGTALSPTSRPWRSRRLSAIPFRFPWKGES